MGERTGTSGTSLETGKSLKKFKLLKRSL